MRYYAYLYRLDGIPSYVGKGTRKKYPSSERCLSHITPTPKTDWQAHVSTTDALIEIQTWDFETSEEACLEECRLIALFGRLDKSTGTLWNRTSGGEGVRDWSDERKERMRLRKRGFKHSEETKARMSATRMGKKIAPMSEERKQKQSERMTGTKLSASHRLNISNGLTKTKQSIQ